MYSTQEVRKFLSNLVLLSSWLSNELSSKLNDKFGSQLNILYFSVSSAALSKAKRRVMYNNFVQPA
jgi:hypothetical protein